MVSIRDDHQFEVPFEAREPLGEVPLNEPNGRERVVVTRPSAVAGVEIWNVKSSRRRWSIFHENYAFCAVNRWLETDFRQSWWYRHRTYSMDSASVMTIEPGEVHVTKQVPLADFHVLLVEPRVVGELLGDAHRTSVLHFNEGQYEDGRLAGALLGNPATQAECVSTRLKFKCEVMVGEVETCVIAMAPSRGCTVPSAECRRLICV
jgi:hypothetical protein